MIYSTFQWVRPSDIPPLTGSCWDVFDISQDKTSKRLDMRPPRDAWIWLEVALVTQTENVFFPVREWSCTKLHRTVPSFWRQKSVPLHFTIVSVGDVFALVLQPSLCVCPSVDICDWQEMEQPWGCSPPARVERAVQWPRWEALA